jgi:hypothetical protein
MAKVIYRALVLFIVILLASCATLKYQPENRLVKVEVQKLVPTENCGGKGIRAYSAKGLNKFYLLEKSVFYLSPGNWEIAYYPAYEELQNGICEEMERLLVHGEYTISHEFEPSFTYFIHLNNELVASIKNI